MSIKNDEIFERMILFLPENSWVFFFISDRNRCPVRSFVKLVKRLNPKCDRILPKDGVYFDNVPLVHYKLGYFMSEISKKAGLSNVYTNHS